MFAIFQFELEENFFRVLQFCNALGAEFIPVMAGKIANRNDAQEPSIFLRRWEEIIARTASTKISQVLRASLTKDYCSEKDLWVA